MPSNDPEYSKKHYAANKERYMQKQRERRKLKRDWFYEYKKTLKCKYCPENFTDCLDFHHVGDDKTGDVSLVMRSKSKETVMAEVAKCEVVCANCHRKIHAGLKLMPTVE